MTFSTAVRLHVVFCELARRWDLIRELQGPALGGKDGRQEADDDDLAERILRKAGRSKVPELTTNWRKMRVCGMVP